MSQRDTVAKKGPLRCEKSDIAAVKPMIRCSYGPLLSIRVLIAA